ncbi:hypothetical protein [Methylococcus capsulatus]|uniref:hypothetical protein n=1 Tax=Methylococcus capsulatus TaxID=414 RepID=UPI001C52DB05|nr:hypothetical protein [Methylococcus capsulatus]QXP94371.1 hypothetical protein KW113_04000 [Methylococcus capsulatus]
MNRQSKAAPGLAHREAAQRYDSAINCPQKLRSAQPINELLSRLEGVKQVGPCRWMAKSPTRLERTASLSIRECDDGRVLLHDFGGDAVDDVLAAVGMEVKDLFPPKDPPMEGLRPRRGIPEHRARDLIRLAAREAGIVSIVIHDILSGNGTSVDDCQRALRAAETLAEIAREVSSHA